MYFYANDFETRYRRKPYFDKSIFIDHYVIDHYVAIVGEISIVRRQRYSKTYTYRINYTTIFVNFQ